MKITTYRDSIFFKKDLIPGEAGILEFINGLVAERHQGLELQQDRILRDGEGICFLELYVMEGDKRIEYVFLQKTYEIQKIHEDNPLSMFVFMKEVCLLKGTHLLNL